MDMPYGPYNQVLPSDERPDLKEVRDYYTSLDRLEAKRSGLDGSLSRLY